VSLPEGGRAGRRGRAQEGLRCVRGVRGALPAGHQPRGEQVGSGPPEGGRGSGAGGACGVRRRQRPHIRPVRSPRQHGTATQHAARGAAEAGEYRVMSIIMGTPRASAPVRTAESPASGRISGHIAGLWRHAGASIRGHSRPETQRTPRTPTRAHLPLLPSGPGGVRRDDAARGVCTQRSPGPGLARNPCDGPAIRSAQPGLVSSLRYPGPRSRPECTRRIRLVAYGARLESVLG
jgi:hypothetical protein